MLERDYIMRLIREFMAALQRFLEKPETNRGLDEIKELYRQYVGDYTFYHTASLDEVMESMEQYAAAERLPRLEMLSELYYQEADMQPLPFRYMLLDKAYKLFSFISEHDKTYSFDRIRKMDRIRKELNRQQAAEPKDSAR